jgi:tetratricopeptide (TPR) repeat protein
MLFDTRITTPYPGLRTFAEYETPIFFGRDDQSDQLIEKLRGDQHFLAVLGLSGSGKSSLVRTGLLAGLQRGFLDEAGIRWRVAEMRPGDQPFANLARALLQEALQKEYAQHFQQGNPLPFLQADLCRNDSSLHELLQTSGFPENVNLLVIVDQFEELFRYYQNGNPDQATAFVKLLLTSMSPWAARPQQRHRIYIVLTMRSEQIGQSALFEGLPEAINQGLFLVPRLTGDQLRAALVGPARVFGGQVADELVTQLLTDVGTHVDQLPLLQHALMRMWNLAIQEHPATPPTLTLAHYHAVGGFQEALTRHGNEIYDHLPPVSQAVAEKLFRSLTNGLSDQYDTRRPVPIQEVATLARVNWQKVASVVEKFRRDGCHFLTPFPSQLQKLQADTVIDLTHESLIRKWQRLKEWAQQETDDARLYHQLEEAAYLWDKQHQRPDDLWRGSLLASVLEWQARANPTDTWAHRYGKQFDLAMQFLVTSKATQQEDLQRLERQNELALRVVRTLTHDFVGKLIEIPRTLPIVSQVIDANVATLEEISALFPETAAAQREKAANLLFMGDMWRLLGQTDKEFDAYQRSHEIFSKLAQDDPNNAQAQRDVSVSLDNIGDVHGQQGNTQAALEAYQQSLSIRKRLAQDDPNNAQAQRDVSISWNNMGNVQLQQGNTQAALEAYQQSLTISKRLAQDDPNNAQAQRDVSVSLDNIGNVHRQQGNTQAALEAYQQSLSIRKRLAQDDPNNAQAQRDLWVSLNKMGDVQLQQGNTQAALEAYQQSLTISKRLAQDDPNNAQAQRDVSVSLNKMGDVQGQQGNTQAALEAYQQSLTISKRLAQDDPNNAQAQRDVSISWEKMGNVQGQQGNTQAALEAYQQSLTIRVRLAQDDPNNAQAQRDLWLSYSKIGEVSRTTEDWEAALQSYQLALPIAEPLAFLDTSNQQAQQDLGYVLGRVVELLNRQGRSEEALAIYDRLIEKDATYLLTRAALHYSLGHLEAFKQDVLQFEEGVTPQEAAETLNSLGWEWAETYGLYPLAFELLTRAVQLAPDQPHILDSLGWVLYKMDKLTESLSYLRQAYARLDETISEELAVEIGLHVGEVLGASGEQGEAQQVWEEMLKKYPENEELRERVKQAE